MLIIRNNYRYNYYLDVAGGERIQGRGFSIFECQLPIEKPRRRAFQSAIENWQSEINLGYFFSDDGFFLGLSSLDLLSDLLSDLGLSSDLLSGFESPFDEEGVCGVCEVFLP